MGRGLNIISGLVLIAIVANSYIEYFDISNLWIGIILIIATTAVVMGSIRTDAEIGKGSRELPMRFILIEILAIVVAMMIIWADLTKTIYPQYYLLISIGFFGIIFLLLKPKVNVVRSSY